MENFIFCAAILQSKCYFAIIQMNFAIIHKENDVCYMVNEKILCRLSAMYIEVV